MPEHDITVALRAFAVERNYSAATLDRWLRLGTADGAALLALAQELRLGENQLRDLWDWAQEIGDRDGLRLVQVLALDAVSAARRRRVSRNDRLKLVKAVLRRLRFPQLAATEARLAALVHQLGLPSNVRVTLPEFLEGDEIRIEIVAQSATALHDAAARLLAAAQTPASDAIFALLTEAP